MEMMLASMNFYIYFLERISIDSFYHIFSNTGFSFFTDSSIFGAL